MLEILKRLRSERKGMYKSERVIPIDHALPFDFKSLPN